MTKRELYKHLKENKLFSLYCAHLARSCEYNNRGTLSEIPREKLEFYQKIHINYTDLHWFIEVIDVGWRHTQEMKIIYGYTRKKTTL